MGGWREGREGGQFSDFIVDLMVNFLDKVNFDPSPQGVLGGLWGGGCRVACAGAAAEVPSREAASGLPEEGEKAAW